MSIGAFIEMIKTGLKKISWGKDAKHTPTNKNRKVTKPAKASTPKKNENKKDSTAKPASTKKGKEKTSTGNKRKIKR